MDSQFVEAARNIGNLWYALEAMKKEVFVVLKLSMETTSRDHVNLDVEVEYSAQAREKFQRNHTMANKIKITKQKLKEERAKAREEERNVEAARVREDQTLEELLSVKERYGLAK